MTRPTFDSRWADGSGATRTEPNSGQKDSGFANREAPGAGFFNWLVWALFRWVGHLDLFTDAPAGVAAGNSEVISVATSSRAIYDAAAGGGTVAGLTFESHIQRSTLASDYATWNDTGTLSFGHNFEDQGICHGNSIYVAVQGSSVDTAADTDPSTWTPRAFESMTDAVAVHYAAFLSLFIAIGAGGEYERSANGTTGWTNGAAATAAIPGWRRLCDNGARVVAVGDGGLIAYTDDGINWTLSTSGTAENLRRCIWTGAVFVAFGANGTILTSPTAASGSWTAQTAAGGYTGTWQAGATVNGTVLLFGTDGEIQSAPDSGHRWTRRGQMPGSDYSAVAYDGCTLIAFLKDPGDDFSNVRARRCQV